MRAPYGARGGGHCFAGRSSTEGIVVDVSPIRSISVSGGVATIGAGSMLGTESDTRELLDEVVARVGTDPASASLRPASYRDTKRYLAVLGDAMAGEDDRIGERYGITWHDERIPEARARFGIDP